jgi:RNA polymerase sigma factor (sigma-70 family)
MEHPATMSTQMDQPGESAAERWAPTRQTLLERLKDWGDQESWREFFDLYARLIFTTALKAGLSSAEAEDVVQETVLSVAKKMPSFQYDRAQGTFKGWLCQLIGWRIARQLQKRQRNIDERLRDPEGDSRRTETIERIPDPVANQVLEDIWDAEWQENITTAALERVRAKVNPKHYQIFQLYALRQKPMAEIRSFLGVSAAEVYLAKHRVGRLLEKEIRRLKAEYS